MYIVIQLTIGLILSPFVCECVDSDVFGLKYLDTSVDPCDNFYNFACGNFDKYYQRADDQPVLDLFTLTEDEIVLKGNETLSNPSNPSDPEALKKAKMAYRACVHEEFDTSTPEFKIADEFGGFPLMYPNTSTSPLTWTQIGEVTRKFGIHHFFHFTINKFDPEDYILLMQPDSWEEPAMIRPKYVRNYDEILEEQFKKAGRNLHGRKMAVAEEITDSFDVLLTSLSVGLTAAKMNVAHLNSDVKNSIAKDLADVRHFMSVLFSGGLIGDNDTILPLDSIVTLAELQEWTNQQFGNTTDMNWKEYLDEIFKWSDFDGYIEDDFPIFLYSTIDTIYGVLNLIKQTDPRIVKNFVLLRTFIFLAPDSDAKTKKLFENYYKANDLKFYDRWEYCTRKILDVADTPGLSFAVAYDFGRHHFNANKIPEVVRLINTLRKSYNQSFESLDWVNDDDREVLKEKLENIFVSLAYPEISNNRISLDTFYENVEICQGDNYGNSQRIRALRHAYSFNEYGDNSFWGFSPFQLNALYARANNRIKLPLAMLQDGFFLGDNPIFDYSRLGSTLAHEMAHAYDTGGVRYNQEGFQLSSWLSNSTLENFSTKTQCLVDQHNKYYIPELSTYVNGENTVDENVADTSGIRRSFAAFKNLNPPPPVPTGINYTKEQLFFISYATMWCSQQSADYLASVTNYPPTSYRIISSLSNSEDFSEVFSCPVGSKMNPETKCPVW